MCVLRGGTRGWMHTLEITRRGGGPWPLGCQHDGVKVWDLIELQGDPIHFGQQSSLKPLSLSKKFWAEGSLHKIMNPSQSIDCPVLL